MSDDLVSRLKSPEVFISIGGMTSLVAHEAADRIETQAAEITRLRAEREALQKRVAEVEAKLNLLMGPPPDKVSLRAGMIAAGVSEKTADEILRSPAFNRAALGGKER